MNYTKHYDALIQRARLRKLDGCYHEIHHVLPKCLGGSDEPSNLVSLTAEEHFVAHQLLIKIHPQSSKLAYAALLMTTGGHKHRIQNKLYGWLKRKLAVAKSLDFKDKVWSEEQNKARSERVKAQWSDPEFKAARSAAMRGRTWSLESRAAKSASMRGKPGRVWTAEQKEKLSVSKRKPKAERSLYVS